MTPEERLARLETRADGQDAWLQAIASDVKALRTQADMGHGALMILLKFGAWAAALAAGIAWIAEKLHLIK
jgi:uncharacterized coiled-coil protein SlyX